MESAGACPNVWVQSEFLLRFASFVTVEVEHDDAANLSCDHSPRRRVGLLVPSLNVQPSWVLSLVNFPSDPRFFVLPNRDH